MRGLGEDAGELEAVHETRGAADAVMGESGVEIGRAESLAGLEDVGEVKGIEAASDADLSDLILLDGDLPVSAPTERAEPDVAGVLVAGVAALDGEPWIDVVAGGSAAAAEDDFAGMEVLFLEIPLASPASGEVAELVVTVGRKVPGGGEVLLDGEGLTGLVLDGGGAAQNAGSGIDLVLERDVHGEGDVLRDDIEGVTVDGVGDVFKDEVAVAVGEGDFEIGNVVEAAAEADVFLGGSVHGWLEGSPGRIGVGRREIVRGGEALAPVDGLKLAASVNAEDVGGIGGIDAEDMRLCVILNRGGWGLAASRRCADHQHGCRQREGFPCRKFAGRICDLERVVH